MRRVGLSLGAALVAALTLSAAALADQPLDRGITLTAAKGTTFPQRQYLLSLPTTGSLSEQNITVLENGETVNDLKVTLPGTGGSRTGAVLLIDASKSMEGEPIVKATDAAQAFATRLPSRIELAVIPFNNKTPVVLPLTNDPTRIANTLSKPPALAYGTRIDDAVQAGAKLLQEQGVQAGSIILLSDGADVGSVSDLQTALATAKEAGVKIYAIGLDSPQFDPKALSAYATGTGGSYVLAKKPDDLAPIFRAVGKRLSNQYLLSYESFAGPGETVYVSVRAAGMPGLATTSYASPGLPATTVEQQSWWDRTLQSGWLAVLVCLTVVGLFGWAVYTLVRVFDRRFERRMARFISLSDEEKLEAATGTGKKAKDDDDPAEDRSGLRSMRWFRNLETTLALSRIKLTAGQLVGLSLGGAVAVAIVAVAVTGLWWTALLGVGPILIANSWVNWKLRKIRRDFSEQLPETLDVVTSALRAGHSLVGALGVAVEGAPEPSRTELGRALADERLGVPLDVALKHVARRMDNSDLVQVSLVAMLQREAGTNSAEVLDQVSTNIRHMIELRRLIRTLTAQGRMSRWIVSLLPIGLFFALFSINRNYLRPLWETTGGTIALIVAAIMILAGSLVIKRIVEIDA